MPEIGYTMLLNEHTGNEYGQIVAEKDEEKGFQLAPGQGLLVLQVCSISSCWTILNSQALHREELQNETVGASLTEPFNRYNKEH
jgi:hypothetical protein